MWGYGGASGTPVVLDELWLARAARGAAARGVALVLLRTRARAALALARNRNRERARGRSADADVGRAGVLQVARQLVLAGLIGLLDRLLISGARRTRRSAVRVELRRPGSPVGLHALLELLHLLLVRRRERRGSVEDHWPRARRRTRHRALGGRRAPAAARRQ